MHVFIIITLIQIPSIAIYLCYHCSLFSILGFSLCIGFDADITDAKELYEII